MERQQHKVFNLIILDESGSMNEIKQPTIRGFNEVVQTIKDVETKFQEQKHYISLVTFNGSGIKERLWNEEVSNLVEINESLYHPANSTPLLDAIGQSVSKLNEELSTDTTYNVLVTVLTDGEENASRHYTGPDLKRMIDELKQKSWTFAYIGANHDVEKAAMSISITNTLRFDASDAGLYKMFDKEKKARMAFSQKIASKMIDKNIAFNLNFYEEEEDTKKKKN
jgi:Mg-chelatase subunit ChlD